MELVLTVFQVYVDNITSKEYVAMVLWSDQQHLSRAYSVLMDMRDNITSKADDMAKFVFEDHEHAKKFKEKFGGVMYAR